MSARDDRAEAMEDLRCLIRWGADIVARLSDRDGATLSLDADDWDDIKAFQQAAQKHKEPAPIATPADDAVARARERVVEAAMAWRGTNTDDYRLNMAVDALLAAERAAKGGATTGAADCDDAPAPEFTCPKCGSHEFGTSNCTSPVSAWVDHCHRPGCRFSWPRESDDIKYFTPRLAEHDGNGGA